MKRYVAKQSNLYPGAIFITTSISIAPAGTWDVSAQYTVVKVLSCPGEREHL